MKYRGRDIELYVQDKQEVRKIAYSTGCELDISRSLTLTSGLSNNTWNGYRKGRSSWILSCDTLHTDEVTYIRELLLTGKTVYVHFRFSRWSKIGKAIIVKITENEQKDNMSRMSIQLQGVGRLIDGDDVYKILIFNTDFFELTTMLKNY